MAKVYIHMGMHKTGTTAIQHYMYHNRNRLYQKGIIFPAGSEYVRFPNTGEQHNGRWLEASYGKPRYEKNLRTLLDQCGKADAVVISHENMFYAYYMDRGMLRDIKKLLNEAGHQLDIILYLRRQDEYMVSFYNQNVKDYYQGTFAEWIDEHHRNGNVEDYAAYLRMLEEDLGREHLHIRTYDRQRFREEGITLQEDFMHVLGFEDLSGFETPKSTMNLSLQDIYMECKRHLNRYAPYNIKSREEVEDSLDFEAARSVKKILIGMQEQSRAAGTLRNRSPLSAGERRELLAQYEESNRQVAEEYLGWPKGKPLFSTEIQEGEAAIYTEKEVIDILAVAMHRQARQYIELREQYEALREQTRLRNLPGYVFGKLTGHGKSGK